MSSEDDVVVDEDRNLLNFMPSGFGRQERHANVEAQLESARRLNAPENQQKPKQPADDDESSEGYSDDDDDDDDSSEFPTSHELVIKTHEKAVSSITLDPAGNRLTTGSLDGSLKLHDFSSMTSTTIRAFKSCNPIATKRGVNADALQPVHKVLVNPMAPSVMLAVCSFPQASLLDRDGEMLAQFTKGDVYLRDMNVTKGHVAEITDCDWSPNNADLCVTSALDSTVRIWDINNPRSVRNVLNFRSKAPGSAGRTRMTALKWANSSEGNSGVIFSTALDGSLVMWADNGPYSRPVAEVPNAHVKDSWTSSLDVSKDGRLLVSYGGDDLIKLWDTRKLKTPLTTTKHKSLSSSYPSASISFSPNMSNVLVGSEEGDLHILNSATLKPDLITPVTPGSPLITVMWHERLNQILTGSANAETHTLFNPDRSIHGAKAVLERAPKQRHIDDDPNRTVDISQGLLSDAIVNSGAARGQGANKRSGRKAAEATRPHMPQATPFAHNQPDEERINERIPQSRMVDEDPREALLKYSGTDSDRTFTGAYKDTQPKTLYAELSDDEEENQRASKRPKR